MVPTTDRATCADKLESTLQRWFIKEAASHGALAFKVVAPGRRGWPDVIVMKRDIVALVELKAPGRKPEPQQAMLHRRLRVHIPVFTVTNYEEAARVFAFVNAEADWLMNARG